MRSRAIALALLLSGAALADPPIDAPVAIDVRKGDAAPSDGVFIPASLALEKAKKCAQAEADRDRYRSQVANQPLPSDSLMLGAAVAGVVIGALIGGFAVAMARK